MVESETDQVRQQTSNTEDITVGEKSLESQQSDAVVLSTPLMLD